MIIGRGAAVGFLVHRAASSSIPLQRSIPAEYDLRVTCDANRHASRRDTSSGREPRRRAPGIDHRGSRASDGLHDAGDAASASGFRPERDTAARRQSGGGEGGGIDSGHGKVEFLALIGDSRFIGDVSGLILLISPAVDRWEALGGGGQSGAGLGEAMVDCRFQYFWQ